MKVFVRVRSNADSGVTFEAQTWVAMLERPPKEWTLNGKTYEVKAAHAFGHRRNSWIDLELDVPEEELWATVGGPVLPKRGRPTKE